MLIREGGLVVHESTGHWGEVTPRLGSSLVMLVPPMKYGVMRLPPGNEVWFELDGL